MQYTCSDQQTSLEALEHHRWLNGFGCPRYGGEKACELERRFFRHLAGLTILCKYAAKSDMQLTAGAALILTHRSSPISMLLNTTADDTIAGVTLQNEADSIFDRVQSTGMSFLCFYHLSYCVYMHFTEIAAHLPASASDAGHTRRPSQWSHSL